MSTGLDPAYVKTWCEQAKGARFMGVLVEEMTREELMAMAVAGWKAEANTRHQLAQRTAAICT